MKASSKSNIVACLVALIVIGLGVAIGGDVVVRQGRLEADSYVWAQDVYASDDVDVTDDLEVDGTIGLCSGPTGFFANIILGGAAYFQDDVCINGMKTLYCGKIDGGYFDPEWVQYDRQTRTEVVESVKKRVPPEKQGEAVLFFNQETRRLEIYIPNEGKFYNLEGSVVYSLAIPEVPTTEYATVYYLDNSMGRIKARQEALHEEYVLKKGYAVDEKTGQFVNRGTGKMVAREEALELYVASEGKYYDLEGNLLRSEPGEQEVQYVYVTEYYFDSRTGEVIANRKAVRDRYVIKQGFRFDKKTGQFIDEATGEAVAKEMAVELKREL